MNETIYPIKEVAVDRDRSVLTLRLNVPDRLNAATDVMLHNLADLVEAAAFDPEVRALVMTGTGRAFCSGADLGAEDALSDNGIPNPSTVDAANRLVTALTAIDKPVVCGLNGLAAGLGASLALACDIVVAHERAYLLLAFAKVGLMPDGGATALVAASLGRSRAMQLALLADRLPVSEAHASGLVWSVHDDASFANAVEELAGRLAAGPTVALGSTKRAINAASIGNLTDALQAEKEGQMRLVVGPEYAEGVRAFAERRPAVFEKSLLTSDYVNGRGAGSKIAPPVVKRSTVF
jgi:enoyl-CoA hydratase